MMMMIMMTDDDDQASHAGILRLQLQNASNKYKHVSFSSILPPSKIDDVEYEDDTPDDVSAASAWGYCDSKCHVSVRDLGATVLQEVSCHTSCHRSYSCPCAKTDSSFQLVWCCCVGFSTTQQCRFLNCDKVLSDSI